MDKKWLYAFFLSLTMLASCMPPQKMIYLGPGSESIFLSDELRPMNFEGSYEFLGYQTFRHDTLGQKNTHEINRLGLILHAKRTESLTVNAEAVFGKNDNTSLVVYEANVKIITKGRSALFSIFNFFSKEENKQPQEEPKSHIGGIGLKGKISLSDKVIDFTYGISFNDKAGCKDCIGKILYLDDSLLVKLVTTYRNKKGKTKKGYTGILVQKSNTIYAAISNSSGTSFVYLNSTISEEEKLLAATCLFIIAAYTGYKTPFVDMTPD